MFIENRKVQRIKKAVNGQCHNPTSVDNLNFRAHYGAAEKNEAKV